MARAVLLLAVAALLGACQYYIPIQVAPSTTPLHNAKFERISPVTATRCDPDNSLSRTVQDALALARPYGANALIDVVVEMKVVQRFIPPFIFWRDFCTVVSGVAVRVAVPRDQAGQPAAATPGGPPGAAPTGPASGKPCTAHTDCPGREYCHPTMHVCSRQ